MKRLSSEGKGFLLRNRLLRNRRVLGVGCRVYGLGSVPGSRTRFRVSSLGFRVDLGGLPLRAPLSLHQLKPRTWAWSGPERTPYSSACEIRRSGSEAWIKTLPQPRPHVRDSSSCRERLGKEPCYNPGHIHRHTTA